MPMRPEAIQALTTALSPERVAHWRQLADRPTLREWRTRTGFRMPCTDEAAIRLHEWNSALSMAFLGSIGLVEIALRNHMHNALRAYRGRDDWWDPTGQHLIPNDAEAIAGVLASIGRRSVQASPGRIVSGLSLGFWWSLTSGSYDNSRDADRNYWRTCLAPTFQAPGQKIPQRSNINTEINTIRGLRNDIAHFEPIVHKDLNATWLSLLHLSRLISPETEIWMREQSLVPGLLTPDWVKVLRAGALVTGLR